jgi:hypothetical protein
MPNPQQPPDRSRYEETENCANDWRIQAEGRTVEKDKGAQK